RERLALDMLIRFMCGCTVFVIVFLGRLICPTEYIVFSSGLAAHSFQFSPNKV
ncbi:hypothetical protein DFH06DRAFT_956313, partial [Mycena polygramma]